MCIDAHKSTQTCAYVHTCTRLNINVFKCVQFMVRHGMTLLTPEEVRQINKEIAQACKKELVTQGKLSDRNVFQVDRSAYVQCFKRKWKERAKQLIMEKLGA